MRTHVLLLACIGLFHLVQTAFAEEYSKDVVIYQGSVGTVKVKVTGSTRPFSRTAHQVTESRNAGTEARPDWKPSMVDGHEVVGTDMLLPEDGTPQLADLTVWFGEQKVSVPVKYLHHVFRPHVEAANFDSRYASTLVAFSADGQAVHISLGIADAAASATYDLIITSKGVVATDFGRPAGS